MTVKHIGTTIDLSNEAEDTILECVENTIQNEASFPSYLTITALAAEHYSDFLAGIADRAAKQSVPRAKATLKLDPDAELPPELAGILTPMQTEFQDWRQGTVIRRNFSDDTFTTYVEVSFNTHGDPSEAVLHIGFKMWGLPESGMPSFEDAAVP